MTHYADPVAYDWESFMYQIGDLIGGNSAGSFFGSFLPFNSLQQLLKTNCPSLQSAL